MKVEIILGLVWTSLCACERQQRSTVLTDEYKRVLEQFDFSNFDKQEALNYIDRQRYENQIRGKRSHSKFKRDHGRTGKISDVTVKETDSSHNTKINSGENPNLRFPISEKVIAPEQIYVEDLSPEICSLGENQCLAPIRCKRGRHGKKKHRSKYIRGEMEGGEEEENEYEEEEEEGEEEEGEEDKFRRRRKKKKRKKRKRHYWNEWSEWSPCSVTCGRGRKIRWRKCIVKNCTLGEFEMGEKTCQLPACNLLTKLLGL